MDTNVRDFSIEFTLRLNYSHHNGVWTVEVFESTTGELVNIITEKFASAFIIDSFLFFDKLKEDLLESGDWTEIKYTENAPNEDIKYESVVQYKGKKFNFTE